MSNFPVRIPCSGFRETPVLSVLSSLTEEQYCVLAAAVPRPILSRAGDLGEEAGLRSRQAVGLCLTHTDC